MSSKDYLKPTMRGFRDPQESGIGTQGMIDNPPRYAQIGKLTSAGKIKHKLGNNMRVKKPGQTENY
jgi:hypothetical protein